jgi:hypothetical protein
MLVLLVVVVVVVVLVLVLLTTVTIEASVPEEKRPTLASTRRSHNESSPRTSRPTVRAWGPRLGESRGAKERRRSEPAWKNTF